MPRDLLGGFKRKPKDDEMANATQVSPQIGGGGGTSFTSAPAQPRTAAPATSGFTNFDRVLGLNQDKVNRSAGAVRGGVLAKVGAAGDAASGVQGAFQGAVNKGTNSYLPNSIAGSVAKDNTGRNLWANDDVGINMHEGSTTQTGEGLTGQSTKPGAVQQPLPQSPTAAPIVRGQVAPQQDAAQALGAPSLLNGFRSNLGAVAQGQYAPQTREQLAAYAGQDYKGPSSLSDMAGYAGAQTAAGEADRALGGLGSTGGLANLLGYQTPAGGELSGSGALDTGLLQGSAGGSLAALKKKYGNFTTDLAGANEASKGISEQGRLNSQNAKDAYGRDLAAYDANEADVAKRNADSDATLRAEYDKQLQERKTAQESENYLKSPQHSGSYTKADGSQAAPGHGQGGEPSVADKCYKDNGLTPDEADGLWNSLSANEKADIIRGAHDYADNNGTFIDSNWNWHGYIARQLALLKAKRAQAAQNG